MLMPIPTPYIAAAAADPTISFGAGGYNGSNISTYNFGTKSVGAADASRYVLVAVTAQDNASDDPSSVTVGGNSATKIFGGINANLSGTYVKHSFWIVALASGTTANVTVTFPSAQYDCTIGVYATYDLSAPTTPVVTNSANTSTATSGSLTLAAGAVAGTIGVGACATRSAGTITISSDFTEDYEETSNNPDTGYGSGTLATSGNKTFGWAFSFGSNTKVIAGLLLQ